MARIIRDRDSIVDSVAIMRDHGDDRLVHAEELAAECRQQGINPSGYTLYCPGIGTDGTRCRCKLVLCASDTDSKVSAYFAHRDHDRSNHVDGCDARYNIQTVAITRSPDLAFANTAPGEVFVGLERGGQDKKNKSLKSEQSTGDEDGLSTIETIIAERNHIEYVPITSPKDLYLATARVMRQHVDVRAATGEKPQEVLINCDTISLYRAGAIRPSGHKLAVARLCTDETIRKYVCDYQHNPDAIVLEDPYIKSPGERRLIYILHCPRHAADYYYKKIKKAKSTLYLIAGELRECIRMDTNQHRYCMMMISAVKGSQLIPLTDHEELQVQLEGGDNACKIK